MPYEDKTQYTRDIQPHLNVTMSPACAKNLKAMITLTTREEIVAGINVLLKLNENSMDEMADCLEREHKGTL